MKLPWIFENFSIGQRQDKYKSNTCICSPGALKGLLGLFINIETKASPWSPLCWILCSCDMSSSMIQYKCGYRMAIVFNILVYKFSPSKFVEIIKWDYSVSVNWCWGIPIICNTCTQNPRYNAVFGVHLMAQRYKWGSVV